MAKEDIRKTFLNQNPEVGTTILQIFGKYFRAFFFLFHWIVKRITIDKSVHTIISSSHAVAKGVEKIKNNYIYPIFKHVISNTFGKKHHCISETICRFFAPFYLFYNQLIKNKRSYQIISSVILSLCNNG